jgi:Periplasmic binding protein
MFPDLSRLRDAAARILVLTLGLVLASCTAGTSPGVGPGAPVQVALLVPGGGLEEGDNYIAAALENAARMAIADLGAVQIDLRVYQTAASPELAATMAAKAVTDGAQVILGPFYALEANAAGKAVAASGVNVLSFSNNTDVAGGNVYLLGQTFDATARRLAGFAVAQGKGRIMVIHDPDAAGLAGKSAIERAVAAAGGSVAAVSTYEFSQNGVIQAIPAIVASARSSGAQAAFLTADNAGALPLISQLLMENGVGPGTIQFIGLSRWDVPPATLALPGVQGAWFALPDPATNGQFQARYAAAYGETPPIYAGFAYDGIAAIGAIAAQGATDGLSAGALTQSAGFVGVGGIFRLRPDGTTDRGLAIAQIQDNQVVIVDPAPSSFGGVGF